MSTTIINILIISVRGQNVTYKNGPRAKRVKLYDFILFKMYLKNVLEYVAESNSNNIY